MCLKNIILMMIVMIAVNNNCLANKVVNASAKEVRLVVSSNEINRISLDDDIVLEVIGDIGKYNMITCQQKKNLFLTFKMQSPCETKLTISTASGKMQDIVLVPQKIKGQTITLRFGKSGSTKSANRRTEITQMLRAMKTGNCDNYYVIEVNELLSNKQALLEVRKRKLYRRGDFTGVVLEVTNNSEEAMQISPEDFLASFKGVVASGSSCPKINHGQVVLVFVITYGGEHA